MTDTDLRVHLVDHVHRQIDPRSRLCRLLAERLLREQAEPDAIAGLHPGSGANIPLRADRVLLQDYTGIPALVDLASLPGSNGQARIETMTHLVLDHSTPVEVHATADSLQSNLAIELERNRERYSFVRALEDREPRLTVVPPGSGICHQLNLEHFAQVAMVHNDGSFGGEFLVGSDSHTTMTNGLGMLGIGVGGIDAVAAMTGGWLGIAMPEVHAIELTGSLVGGVTAYDLALELVARVRECVPVGSVLEFNGAGVSSLSIADRATVANLAPECGVRMALFPVDQVTTNDLCTHGRSQQHSRSVARWAHLQGLDRFTDAADTLPPTITLDLSTIRPNLAGPTQPHQVVPIAADRHEARCSGGDKQPVVLAAIASCASTSNPELMVRAGLIARNAVDRGLVTPAHVKTAFSPGSRDVIRYLDALDLMAPLEKLGFHVVAFGCASCDGNSGPLTEAGAALAGAAVISSNRNYERRIHAAVEQTYLMSPEFVVANAVAGHVLHGLADPVAFEGPGVPITLAELRPSQSEVDALVSKAAATASADEQGSTASSWSDRGSATATTASQNVHEWWSDRRSATAASQKVHESRSLYLRASPFVRPLVEQWPAPITDGRPLAWLGDDVTTDHLSPVGAISERSEAGRWLIANGAEASELSTFGTRRANHEVMLRGALSNPSLADRLRAPDSEQTYFRLAGELRHAGHAAVILAGHRYGGGSSRDWAAKAASGLGVRAVIAQSIEAIHRRNLIACGVAPILLDQAVDFDLHAESSIDLALAGAGAAIEVDLRIDGRIIGASLDVASDEEWHVLCAGGRLPMLAGAR